MLPRFLHSLWFYLQVRARRQLGKEADYWFRLAQPLAESFRNVWNLVNLCANRAIIAHAQQNYAAARLELTRALKLGWNAGYRWVTPRLLLRFARLSVDQNETADAVEILGTLHRYPLAFGETDQAVLAMRDELQARLEPEEFAAAWERGQGRELSVLVAQLLAANHLQLFCAIHND